MSEIINDNIPEEEEAIIVELEDEDGNTTEFEYLDTIGYDGARLRALTTRPRTISVSTTRSLLRRFMKSSRKLTRTSSILRTDII